MDKYHNYLISGMVHSLPKQMLTGHRNALACAFVHTKTAANLLFKCSIVTIMLLIMGFLLHQAIEFASRLRQLFYRKIEKQARM